MATGTIILRPIGFISEMHAPYPSGTPTYVAISDEVSDGDSTYIYKTYTNTGGSHNSIFRFYGEIPSVEYTITSATLHMTARITGKLSNLVCNCYFAIDDYNNAGSDSSMMVDCSSVGTSYTEKTAQSSTMVTAINEYIQTNGSFPYIYGKVNTGGTTSKSKYRYDVRVTQIYLEIGYETVNNNQLTVKQNGVYVPVKDVYKKVSGHWVEQTDLENLFNTGTKYVRV